MPIRIPEVCLTEPAVTPFAILCGGSQAWFVPLRNPLTEGRHFFNETEERTTLNKFCFRNYAADHKQLGFPPNFPDVPYCYDGFKQYGSSLLSDTVVKRGQYLFTYSPATLDRAGRTNSYQLQTTCQSYGTSCLNSFLLTISGEIFFTAANRPATSQDTLIPPCSHPLRWQDIDLANGIITIRRSKHGEARHVQINSVACAALLKLRDHSGEPGYVCPGRDNSRKRYSRQWFEEVTEKAKISNFHWHDLRHTFASRLVMAGVPLRAVQVLMGHKRIETTLRYSHLGEDHLRNAVERLVARKAPMSSQEAPIQLPPEVPPARMAPLLTDRRIERKLRRINGARERTRTSTPLRELAPEASASANSATRAMSVAKLRG